MSASLNVTRSKPTRVLLVAASPTVSTTTGWPVGFWASELIHPWYEFTEAGYETVIASPAGGKLEPDFLSDPRDPSGYSAHDILSMGFLSTPRLAGLLEDSARLDSVDAAGYDALFICGGQGPMFQFRENLTLQGLITTFYEAEKPVAAICHGVSALIDVKLTSGEYLIAGKTVTGFANVEEEFADKAAGVRVMPWRIEDEAKARGANYIQAGLWKAFAVRDGRLITGQQQFSGAEAAKLVIQALGV